MNQYFMQRFPIGATAQPTVDLEVEFEGLRVKEVQGAGSKGKIKNAYTEEYADADSVRVYFPTDIKRGATDFTITVFISGSNQWASYNAFIAYLTGHTMKYWDKVRNLELDFVALEAISPDESVVTGSKYIEVAVKSYKGRV